MTYGNWELTTQLRFNAARTLQQLWARSTVEIYDGEGQHSGKRVEGRETEWRDVPSESAHIHTINNTDTAAFHSHHYMSRADALDLKKEVERMLSKEVLAVAVRCVDILSLIAQSNSANLGLATTGQLLEEIKSRIEVHSPGGLEYRTMGDEVRGTR